MGVAGAGKSVQGKMLAEKMGYTWISTGELLRKELSGDRKKEMLLGKLLEDSEIIKVIEKFFSGHSTKKYILDGFPRTIPQAEWLLKQRESGAIDIDAAIHLKASKEIVKERLLKRGRPDDNEAAISQRFNEYEKHTLPILNCFRKNNIRVFDINAELEVDEVHNQILSKVKK